MVYGKEIIFSLRVFLIHHKGHPSTVLRTGSEHKGLIHEGKNSSTGLLRMCESAKFVAQICPKGTSTSPQGNLKTLSESGLSWRSVAPQRWAAIGCHGEACPKPS